MSGGGGSAPFLLVHPAWFGGWCRKKVAPRLRARGHEVYTPALTGLGERAHLARPDVGLETHVQDVAGVLRCEDLRGAVLVGSSAGGAVITGVAHRVPERIARLVYLDAFVPQDGQALVEPIPPERRAAREALVRTEGETPFGHFTDRARLGSPAAERLPRTDLRCRERPHPGFDRHAEQARRTPGCRCRERAAPHLPYVTLPAEPGDVLLEAAAAPLSPGGRA